jgi:hypothetical protein
MRLAGEQQAFDKQQRIDPMAAEAVANCATGAD